MAKTKYTHKQTVTRSASTGRFVSSKFAKANPKKVKKATVTIKHT